MTLARVISIGGASVAWATCMIGVVLQCGLARAWRSAVAGLRRAQSDGRACHGNLRPSTIAGASADCGGLRVQISATTLASRSRT